MSRTPRKPPRDVKLTVPDAAWELAETPSSKILECINAVDTTYNPLPKLETPNPGDHQYGGNDAHGP